MTRNTALILPALLALAASSAPADDLLLDHYKAEKTRAAAKYQDAMKVCKTRAPAVAPACRNAAESDRKHALLAASAERDAGLKCLSACGLVTSVSDDAGKGSKGKKARSAKHWRLAYALYDGTSSSVTLEHKPALAQGDKIRIENGKPTRR